MTKLCAYQIPKNSPTLMVIQRDLLKLSRSQKKTKIHEWGKDIRRKEEDWEESRVRIIEMYFMHKNVNTKFN